MMKMKLILAAAVAVVVAVAEVVEERMKGEDKYHYENNFKNKQYHKMVFVISCLF
jgi:hypothetical protein